MSSKKKSLGSVLADNASKATAASAATANETAFESAQAEGRASINNLRIARGAPPLAESPAVAAPPASAGKGRPSANKASTATNADTGQRAAKASKPAKEPKARKVSALDAAAMVIAKADQPMTAAALVEAMLTEKLWKSPGGKTPEATLYAAIVREIAAKGTAARFKKHDRGVFVAGRGSSIA